jgi:D,D-heptose 1,7-bisphosphate phosphatase
MNHKAIFLDKDGTLIENVPYNVDPEQIRLTEGASEGLRMLQDFGFRLIVVTNQAGVAYGKYKEDALLPVRQKIQQLLESSGVTLDDFYYCPHHPDGKVEEYAIHCFCRKPNAGLLFKAAREHDINLAASWVIGDILNDMEAGRRVDSRTILLDNGNETEWKLTSQRRPHFTVKTLKEAAEVIIREETKVLPKVTFSRPINISAEIAAFQNAHNRR